jgi:hypothetical protein
MFIFRIEETTQVCKTTIKIFQSVYLAMLSGMNIVFNAVLINIQYYFALSYLPYFMLKFSYFILGHSLLVKKKHCIVLYFQKGM